MLGSAGSRPLAWLMKGLGLGQGQGTREKGGAGKAPRMPGSSPHAFALGCWVGQTSHGLGELQVLMPHSLGALKDEWELLPLGVSVPPTPPAVLAVGLWLVPVPRDPHNSADGGGIPGKN